MSGFIYILKSLKDHRTYTGSTDDLNRRLSEHFEGKVHSTKNRLPLELIYNEKLSTLTEARTKEKYYKSCAGRKKLKIILKDLV